MRTPFALGSSFSASMFSAALIANTAASAQSLLEGVPSIVRSCHDFYSRDWNDAGAAASFLKGISCHEPNKDNDDRDANKLAPAVSISLAALHARLDAAPDGLSCSPSAHRSSPATPVPSAESGSNGGPGALLCLTRHLDNAGGPGVRELNADQDQDRAGKFGDLSSSPSPNINPSVVCRGGAINPCSHSPIPNSLGLPSRSNFPPSPSPRPPTDPNPPRALDCRGTRNNPCGRCICTSSAVWLRPRSYFETRPSPSLSLPLFKPRRELRRHSLHPGYGSYRTISPRNPRRDIDLNSLIGGLFPSPILSSFRTPDSLSTNSRRCFTPGSWLLRPNPSLGSGRHCNGLSISSSINSGIFDSLIDPKAALEVDVRLRGELKSRTGESMIWPAPDGSIIFAKVSSMPSTSAAGEELRRVHSTALVASNAGSRKRVLRVRDVLKKEMEEGTFTVRAKKVKGVCGWLPWLRRHRQDVERARSKLGIVEITLDERARLEVTVDGTKVLSKSGRHKHEWRNRVRWRRKKSGDYELHVVEDGIEVRLGEKTVWGITADRMMG